jgi:hypothetical protein
VADKIVVTHFDAKTALVEGELTLSLDTDLPPQTKVMWGVYHPYKRHFRGKDVEYQLEYAAGKTTVAKIREGWRVDVSKESYERLLAQAKTNVEAKGETWRLTSVDPGPIVNLTVPVFQEPPFADRNANLEGPMVEEVEIVGSPGRVIHWRKSVNPGGEPAMRIAANTLFPGLPDTAVRQLVIEKVPADIAQAIKDPDFHEKLFPMDATGRVESDRGTSCSFTQVTLNGVRHFYDVPQGKDTWPLGLIVFENPKCMRGVAASGNLAANIEALNAKIAGMYFDPPSLINPSLGGLHLPKSGDKVIAGLCLKHRGTVPNGVLVQYLVQGDALLGAIHTGSYEETCQ